MYLNSELDTVSGYHIWYKCYDAASKYQILVTEDLQDQFNNLVTSLQ